jgi:hypothetical protein
MGGHVVASTRRRRASALVGSECALPHDWPRENRLPFRGYGVGPFSSQPHVILSSGTPTSCCASVASIAANEVMIPAPVASSSCGSTATAPAGWSTWPLRGRVQVQRGRRGAATVRATRKPGVMVHCAVIAAAAMWRCGSSPTAASGGGVKPQGRGAPGRDRRRSQRRRLRPVRQGRPGPQDRRHRPGESLPLGHRVGQRHIRDRGPSPGRLHPGLHDERCDRRPDHDHRRRGRRHRQDRVRVAEKEVELVDMETENDNDQGNTGARRPA